MRATLFQRGVRRGCRSRLSESHRNGAGATVRFGSRIAVGMPITGHPPHRSVRAAFPHTVLIAAGSGPTYAGLRLGHSLAGTESGPCYAVPHSSRSHRFPPSTPPRASPFCSPTSSVLPVSVTSPVRTSSASAPRLPDAGRRRIPPPAVKLEISRFPRKERACMPGSPTTPGRPRARDGARRRTAFRYTHSVGTRNQFSFAAGLHVPLPTFRRHPHGCLRTAWGRCGSLLLHRSGLPPPTPCRSPGALTVTPHEL